MNQKFRMKHKEYLAQDRPFRMPKACVSCQYYRHKGLTEDRQHPCDKAQWELTHLGKPYMARYGDCQIHMKEVFASQICGSYLVEDLVFPDPVTNRSEPREAIQERLL